MSKKCAKCEKAVYPAEELKCLDKSWHKPCFRCWECNMALTMSNYKGYNKLPYCNAHVPKPSHTAVETTPQMQQSMMNSKLSSQSQYHADYRKNYQGSVDNSGGSEPNYNRPMKSSDDDDAAPTSYTASQPPPPSMGGGGRANQGLVYTALYDYEAQDEDEVGFNENDRIINCEVVDEGWVTGTVERTGQRGMIPANYIEQA